MSLRDDAASIGDRANGIAAQLRRVMATLSRQHGTYSAVFRPEGKMTPAAAKVLDDLADFCGADTSTYHDDPRRHAMMEGRRQVYLHIRSRLRLDGEKLAALRRELKEHEA